MAALGWLWFAAVSSLLVAVAVTDWRQRLVANRSVVALAALAAFFVAAGDSDGAAVTSRLGAAALAAGVFAVALGGYAARLIGAGDVKMAVPVALIMARVGAGAWILYLGVFIVVGLTVLVVFGRRGRSLPLAPVLGLGVVPALLAANPPWFAV